MLTNVMKWISMGSLLVAAALWGSTVNSQVPQFLLTFVVCLGASVVAVQANQVRKYVWASGFAAIALLFNPIFPFLSFQGEWGRWILLVSIVPFALSLAALKTQPLLSMPSITDRTPGSRSL